MLGSKYQHVAHGWQTGQLLIQVMAHPELWDQSLGIWSHDNGPHAQAHAMWLRGEDEIPYLKRGSWDGYNQYPHFPIWFPESETLTEAKKLIFNTMAMARGESLGNVLIYTVPPGKRIIEHADDSWSVRYNDKFNICLSSNIGASFKYEDDEFYQRPGDVTFFRNDIPHSVVNNGDTDHIILCVCLHRE